MVAVRVRPILKSEIDRGKGTKDILRVMDDRIVLVMDPDPDDKDYLDQVQNRSKVCFVAQQETRMCCMSGMPTAATRSALRHDARQTW